MIRNQTICDMCEHPIEGQDYHEFIIKTEDKRFVTSRRVQICNTCYDEIIKLKHIRMLKPGYRGNNIF